MGYLFSVTLLFYVDPKLVPYLEQKLTMFIYSLPILFTHMNFGTPLEFMLVIFFFLSLLFIMTPENPEFSDIKWGKISDLTFYQYLSDAWTGQVKLWLVFWPFFILLNSSLFLVDSLARNGQFTVSSWDALHFMFFTPILVWTIAVWRNDLNTSSRYWAILARFMTLAVFFEYALKLVIRNDYPRIFFKCQDIALDYASCF